jgi:hypothetical protein
MEKCDRQLLREKRGKPQAEEGKEIAKENQRAQDTVRSQTQEKQVGVERDHKQGGCHPFRWLKKMSRGYSTIR